MLTIALILSLNGTKFSLLKSLTVLFSGVSQALRGIFVGPRSFSYFSARGSEKGGEAELDTKGNIIPQRICATSYHEWSIEKHNIGD